MRETKFKDTELGKIPEDWNLVSLGEIGEVKMCKRIMKHQTSERGEVPFYKIGTFGKDADAFISNELYQSFRDKFNYPNKGDILLSAAGTIGRTVIFDGKPSYFQDSNIVWIANDEKILSNALLFHIYQRLNWVTESGTIPRIYNGIVRSIKFPVPQKKSEQSRIAKILSDIDSLIQSLTKLIEKKKNIKTATMQLLLTGKKRLEGFTEPWVEKRIGEIAKISKGQSLQSKDFVNGHIPVIAGGQTYAGFHNIANHKETSITISASGAYAGYVWLHEYPIFASDCSVIEGNDDVDIHFLYNVLKLKQGEIYKSQTGGAQPHIHPKDIEPIKIVIPFKNGKPNFDEQRTIGNILIEMDNEISALEQKRAKYESIKKGMMQELLTGKIRLV